ncbi:MAG: GlsB/YeaQ/YmgE family stress response membrane protein [Chitinophagales bacterium]|nr:GlsB/YeaQ/YmgE family stress response membrane protein [Chitinophagales bacterium]
MGLIYWLLIGLAAGALAKLVTPQNETGGWISSLVIGIIGSFVGGFAGRLVGIQSSGLLGSLIIATVGAIIVLFVYHKYLADKLNIKV